MIRTMDKTGPYLGDDGVLMMRPLTVEDSQMIVNWRNNPRVRSRYVYREPFTLEGQQAYYHNKIETGETAQFIFCEKESGRPVGCSVLEGIRAAEDGHAAEDIRLPDDIRAADDISAAAVLPGAGTASALAPDSAAGARSAPRCAEYGNWIGEDDAVGKGYNARMVRLTAGYAFGTLRLSELVCRIFADNPASIRGCERAGFCIVKKLPDVECSDGERKDMVLMRLTPESLRRGCMGR